jgi:cytoskeletal protein CcmA (bactofilin family)
MFASKSRGTVIAEGLKIVGSVTAEGLIEVNGQIEGELHCTSLIITRKAHVSGTVEAERVVVDGRVEGPIHGGDVVLKSHAFVVGDILHRTLTIENGAHFDGRSLKAPATNGQQLQSHSEANGIQPRNKVREAISAARTT